ncbi:MAG: ChrR family anti-sigma-E factor [Asticcacaulis sp.]|uniref:ChrR family anti-sigma-E factor n=1 Tax=Asticcacaulis sp. TaxID=1872648 RepID=UPI0039E42812
MTQAIVHHPSEDLLWALHKGKLPPGLSLAVAGHVDICPHCRGQLNLLDAIGGALLEDVAGVDMSENALNLALARIERPEPAIAPQKPQPLFLKGFELPVPLRKAQITGRYWAAPGVWMAPVHLDGAPPGDKTYLMSVKAGMVMPEHSHHCLEATLMLKGRFSDNLGEYTVGDFLLCDPDISHAPAMAPDEDCLCLIWQDAPIRPKTWLGRLLQPFARI